MHCSPVGRRSIDGGFQADAGTVRATTVDRPSSSSSPRPRSPWDTACGSRRRWGPTTSPAGARSGAFSNAGTYVIDDCPWQIETQDKVLREPKGAGGSSPGKHFYSSKPALLPTLIAGILYPARMATGVPLDRVVLQERQERWTQKPDPDSPNKVKGVLETPKDPAKWPAYIFYFKPIIVLLNVVPYGIFLVLFARLLDRLALGDWTWFFCLIAAAFGTYLLPFTQTLNNHTVAAWSVFFAIYSFLRIWDDQAAFRLAICGGRVLCGLRRGE